MAPGYPSGFCLEVYSLCPNGLSKNGGKDFEIISRRYFTFGVASSLIRFLLKCLGSSGLRHSNIGESRSSLDKIGLYHTGSGFLAFILISRPERSF